MKSERYSRFTLQQGEEGENHVEVKLSDDGMDDDAPTAGGSPTFRPAPLHQGRYQLCALALGLLLIFITGRTQTPLPSQPTVFCFLSSSVF